MERNTEFFKRLGKLGIYLLRPVTVLFGRRIIDDILKIDLRDIQMGPMRHLHLLPFPESLQPEIQKPQGFLLLGRNQPYDIFIQPFGYELLLHIRHEAMFILLSGNVFKYIFFCILVHNLQKYSKAECHAK